jgi:hypothetical protein
MQILLEKPLQERRRMPLHPLCCDRITITSTEAKQGNRRSKATNTTEEARQSRDSAEVNGISATSTTEEAT